MNDGISRTASLDEVTSLCDPDGSRPLDGFDDFEMGDWNACVCSDAVALIHGQAPVRLGESGQGRSMFVPDLLN